MLKHEEHVTELNEFFASKYKKDKLHETLKRSEKKLRGRVNSEGILDNADGKHRKILNRLGKNPKLTLFTTKDEFTLLNKEKIVLSRVSRVPKKGVDSAIFTNKRIIVRDSNTLLSIKYDVLFEYSNPEDFQIILHKIDPLENKIKKLQSETRSLFKLKSASIATTVDSKEETLNIERQLIVSQLREERDKETMRQFVENQKALFDNNSRKRELSSSIIQIDVHD